LREQAPDFGRPAATVRAIQIAGGLLILDTATNQLSAYNETAGHLWQLLQDVREPDRLIAMFADAFGIPEATARDDVLRIVGEWRTRGILDTGRREPTPRESPPPVRDSAGQVPAVSLTCTIRDVTFSMSVQSETSARFVQSYFGHLATDNRSADIRIEIAEAGGEEILRVDGVERLRTAEPALLLGALQQTIMETIHSGAPLLAILHGGAVARNGAAIALPAASGSGKSTMIAYLARKGYGYLADDLVALAADGRVLPWPMPLSIKAGSWPVLSGLYDFERRAMSGTGEKRARLIVPDAAVWGATPAEVRCVVFPQYRPGAAPALSRLTTFDAFQRLLRDRVWLGFPITEERVRAMLAWLDDRPAYALTYGELSAAAESIGALM
jgi:hypothetical protein